MFPNPYGLLLKLGAALVVVLTIFGAGWHYGGKGPRADLAKERATFSQFKAELAIQAKKQENENARIESLARSASAAAAVSVQFADVRAANAEQSARDRLASAGDLRGVRVPGSVRDVFDASTRGATEAATAPGRTDASAGRSGAAPADATVADAAPSGSPDANSLPLDLDVLLDTVIVNHTNHLRCVGQVKGLQQYATALYNACQGAAP